MRPADRLVAEVVRRGGRWIVVLTAASVLGSLAGLALPITLGHAVDALVSAGPVRWTPFTICALVMAAVVACDAACVWAGGAAGATATAWLRHRLIRHVLGVGPAITRDVPEGDLVTRMGMNAEELGRVPEAVITGATLLVPSLGGLIAVALIDLWPAVTLLAGLVLIAVSQRAFFRDSTAIAAGYQQAQGELAGRLVEALAGARTIAAAGTHEREARRVLAPLPRLRAHAMDLWRASATAGVRAGAAVPLLEVAVLGTGGLRLAAGDLTPGELYAAARYVALSAGIGAAISQLGRLARARSAATRLLPLITTPTRPYGHASLPARAAARPAPPPASAALRPVTATAAPPRTTPAAAPSSAAATDEPRRVNGTGAPSHRTVAGPDHRRPGTLELCGVSVTGLRGVDLVVPGGGSVAVVGRSGSGKSLLAAIAGRLIDPAEGTVRLDGVPLPDLSRHELRRAIGYAFDRPVLVGDTIGDAIALGLTSAGDRLDPCHPSGPSDCAHAPIRGHGSALPRTSATARDGRLRHSPRDPDRGHGDGDGAGSPAGGEDAAGDGRIREAARMARAEAFIARLPLGYRTPLDQAPMSGGERQRAGLARAFAQADRLLVLDDATSSLDTVTERQVGRALADDPRGRTRLIVAHRAATAAAADRVVWLDDGRLRAQGPHHVLWRDPAYRAVFLGDTP